MHPLPLTTIPIRTILGACFQVKWAMFSWTLVEPVCLKLNPQTLKTGHILTIVGVLDTSQSTTF